MKQWVILLLISSTAISVEATTFFKKVASITAGTTLAFAGHYLCEYMSTFCHELGHACAYKCITGNSSQIRLLKGPHPLAPWTGFASTPDFSAQSRMKQAAIIAAGPLAGIGTTVAQIHILHTLEDKFIPKKQPDVPQSVSIRAYFKNLYNEAYNTTTDFVTEGKTPGAFENPLYIAFKMLKFLRYSRIMGESLYGFTPIKVPEGVGDGQKLWSLLLNRNDEDTVITDRLATATTIIMLSPILLGVFNALIKKKDKATTSL